MRGAGCARVVVLCQRVIAGAVPAITVKETQHEIVGALIVALMPLLTVHYGERRWKRGRADRQLAD